MKFEIKGLTRGSQLDKFRSNWVDFTAHENKILMDDGRVSPAQLLMINVFCGFNEGYQGADTMTISTNGPAQYELEALFRARGRALAALMQVVRDS